MTKRLCTICARGGSKGVKNKNIRPLLGLPLIAHSLKQAKESGLFHSIAVSSDSSQILETAQKWGADLLIERPAELATDTSGKLPAIRHCLLEAESLKDTKFDEIVDIDATSPLRLVQDIINCVKLLEEKKGQIVITAAPARKSPYFNMVELDATDCPRLIKSLPTAVKRRQDSPQCFDMNASIYVYTRDALIGRDSLFHDDTLLYVMPEDRSIDIDTEMDFEMVEYLMRRKTAES